MRHAVTLTEIRNKLAERAGFEWNIETGWTHPDNGSFQDGLHPYPATLDGAARAWDELLPGWKGQHQMWSGPEIDFSVRRYWIASNGAHWSARVADTGNEIEDRFRLAWACVEAG